MEDFIMKMPTISMLEWQQRYGKEAACAATLAKIRWPQGFICPKCGNNSAWFITTRKIYQCSKCRHQVSITADTLFHSTNLPLVKWFWAIYFCCSRQRGNFRLATLQAYRCFLGNCTKYVEENTNSHGSPGQYLSIC